MLNLVHNSQLIVSVVLQKCKTQMFVVSVEWSRMLCVQINSVPEFLHT